MELNWNELKKFFRYRNSKTTISVYKYIKIRKRSQTYLLDLWNLIGGEERVCSSKHKRTTSEKKKKIQSYKVKFVDNKLDRNYNLRNVKNEQAEK